MPWGPPPWLGPDSALWEGPARPVFSVATSEEGPGRFLQAAHVGEVSGGQARGTFFVAVRFPKLRSSPSRMCQMTAPAPFPNVAFKKLHFFAFNPTSASASVSRNFTSGAAQTVSWRAQGTPHPLLQAAETLSTARRKLGWAAAALGLLGCWCPTAVAFSNSARPPTLSPTCLPLADRPLARTSLQTDGTPRTHYFA